MAFKTRDQVEWQLGRLQRAVSQVSGGVSQVSGMVSSVGIQVRDNSGSFGGVRQKLNFLPGANVSVDSVDDGTEYDIFVSSFPIPNTVVGTGAAGRVVVWSDVSTVSSDTAFLWDFTSNMLQVNGTVGIQATPPNVSTPLYIGVSPAGITFIPSFSHTDNTNANSTMRLVLSVGGSSAGDAAVVWSVTGNVDWGAGVDNSDGDIWKIGRSASIGTNVGFQLTNSTTPYVRILNGLSIGSTNPPLGTEMLLISTGVTAIDSFELIRHTDNTTATTDAYLHLQTGGASGGDPLIRFEISGVTNWSMGIDNSDTDRFIIGPASALGAGTQLRLIADTKAVCQTRMDSTFANFGGALSVAIVSATAGASSTAELDLNTYTFGGALLAGRRIKLKLQATATLAAGTATHRFTFGGTSTTLGTFSATETYTLLLELVVRTAGASASVQYSGIVVTAAGVVTLVTGNLTANLTGTPIFKTTVQNSVSNAGNNITETIWSLDWDN